eukprot:g26459.t1
MHETNREEFPNLFDVDQNYGLCHRLDRETSGTVLVGITKKSRTQMRECFHRHYVRKLYVCLVHGFIDKAEQTVDRNLEAMGQKAKLDRRGKRARTHVKVLGYFTRTHKSGRVDQFTLCTCEIAEGRMHQIRLHMAAALGSPIVSEFYYQKAKQMIEDRRWCQRVFLHAYAVGFPDMGATNDDDEEEEGNCEEDDEEKLREWHCCICPLTNELRKVLKDLKPTKGQLKGIQAETMLQSCLDSGLINPNHKEVHCKGTVQRGQLIDEIYFPWSSKVNPIAVGDLAKVRADASQRQKQQAMILQQQEERLEKQKNERPGRSFSREAHRENGPGPLVLRPKAKARGRCSVSPRRKRGVSVGNKRSRLGRRLRSPGAERRAIVEPFRHRQQPGAPPAGAACALPQRASGATKVTVHSPKVTGATSTGSFPGQKIILSASSQREAPEAGWLVAGEGGPLAPEARPAVSAGSPKTRWNSRRRSRRGASQAFFLPVDLATNSWSKVKSFENLKFLQMKAQNFHISMGRGVSLPEMESWEGSWDQLSVIKLDRASDELGATAEMGPDTQALCIFGATRRRIRPRKTVFERLQQANHCRWHVGDRVLVRDRDDSEIGRSKLGEADWKPGTVTSLNPVKALSGSRSPSPTSVRSNRRGVKPATVEAVKRARKLSRRRRQREKEAEQKEQELEERALMVTKARTGHLKHVFDSSSRCNSKGCWIKQTKLAQAPAGRKSGRGAPLAWWRGRQVRRLRTVLEELRTQLVDVKAKKAPSRSSRSLPVSKGEARPEPKPSALKVLKLVRGLRGRGFQLSDVFMLPVKELRTGCGGVPGVSDGWFTPIFGGR